VRLACELILHFASLLRVLVLTNHTPALPQCLQQQHKFAARLSSSTCVFFSSWEFCNGHVIKRTCTPEISHRAILIPHDRAPATPLVHACGAAAAGGARGHAGGGGVRGSGAGAVRAHRTRHGDAPELQTRRAAQQDRALAGARCIRRVTAAAAAHAPAGAHCIGLR
jgi:hypothetical protein